MWNGGSGGSNHGLSLVFGAKGQLRNNLQKIKSRFTDNNFSRSRLVHELTAVFHLCSRFTVSTPANSGIRRNPF